MRSGFWLIWALAAPVLAGEPDLVRVGTVGPLPDKAFEVSIRADGTILVDNKERSFAELRRDLRAGRDDVVLYADRSLPWAAVQWFMTACAEARIHRLWCAVRHEAGGDDIGAMALFLPADKGINPVVQDPINYTKATTSVRYGGPDVDPSALHGELRKLRSRLPRDFVLVLELRSTHHAPAGFVLRVADMAMRAGVDQMIVFASHHPPRDADLKAFVKKLAARRPADGKPSLRLDKRDLRGRADVPRTARSTKPAGLFKSVLPDVVEEEIPEEVVVDDPKKPDPNSPVQRALAWLAKKQDRTTGSFGRVDDTALAVLAFLGAGYSDREGTYTAPVRGGLKYLMNAQAKTVRGHALATLALCEAWGRLRTPRYKLPAQAALDRLYEQGGRWGDDVTWCLMAHTAGRFAGLKDRPELAEAAGKRLEGVAGQLAALLRGKDPLKAPPVKGLDAAGWYLSSIVAFRVSAPSRPEWQDVIQKKVLVRQKRDGSFGTVWDTAAYTLCMEIAFHYPRVFGAR